MAIGTTNIGLSGSVMIEYGKNQSNISLRDYWKNGFNEGDVRSPIDPNQTSNYSMSTFQNYSNFGLTFKWDPQFPAQSATSPDMGLFCNYDGNSSILPNNWAANSGISASFLTTSPTFTQGVGVNVGEAGYLEFDGSATRMKWTAAASGKSYIKNTSNRQTLVTWLRFNVLRAASGAPNIIGNNSVLGSSVAYYGIQIQQNSANDGLITMTYGDGTGAASSDRRTFLTAANSVDDTEFWLCAFFVDGNSTSTANNKIYTTATSEGSGNTTNKVSTTSGTGGNMAFNTSYYQCWGQQSNTTYWDGKIGHVWWFDHHISDDEYKQIYTSTYQMYTGL